MMKVNLVDPAILTDEHLRAENVKLRMLLTFIKKHPTGFIPKKYCLGKGHMSFFRNKYGFIKDRQLLVFDELCNRIGIKGSLLYVPIKKWTPNKEDIKLNESMIIDKLLNPLKKKTPWHYYGEQIKSIEDFIIGNYGEDEQ